MDKIKFVRYYTEFGYRYATDNSNMFLMSLAEFLLTEVVCFGGGSWIDLIDKLKSGDGISGNMIDI